MIERFAMGDEWKDLSKHIDQRMDQLEKTAVYIKPLQKIGLKEIRIVKGELDEKFHNLVLVFVLDKVSGTQRKKLLEEKISFYIENKEMYIIK